MSSQTNILPNGDFKAEITLAGGTGKTTVQSPANVNIADGVITVEVVWSSPNYDLMIVDDKEYKPVSNKDGSVFMIRIPSLDTPLNVQAETVAMSAPHLIDYTITVSGAEILSKQNESNPFETMTSEQIESWINSALNESYDTSGMSQVVISAVVGGGAKSSGGGLPTIAIIGISAALGAAVAWAVVTVWKKFKK